MIPVGSVPARPSSGIEDKSTARCLHVPLGDVGDVTVTTVSCRRHPERWATSRVFPEFGVALPRRGGFRRRLRGAETFVDTTTAIFETPDVDQEIGHDGDGVAVTLVSLPEATLAALTGSADVPLRPIPTTPATDVAHRALLASVRDGRDRLASDEWLARFVGGLASSATLDASATSARQHAIR